MSQSPTVTTNERLIRFDTLHRFALAAFQKAGLSERDAATGAEVLATTDAWGIFTHGTKNLRNYLRRVKAGGIRPCGEPRIATEGPAWAVVDGDSSLGMVTSAFAMQTAIAKARVSGIAYVGVRNSSHFGAAGYYAWLAARAGFIGVSMANDTPSVTAPGARGAITGSNPLAYAIPAGKYRPVMLDIAISTVAGGKVYAARALGKPIPDNWLVGPDGRPTTDPSVYPDTGALMPMAGHKGYGLALLIETLAGILSGAAFTWRVSSWMWDDATKPTQHGAAFLAIDVNTILPAEPFARRMETLIDEIHAAPRAEGSSRIYVPGEMEWERYDRAMKDGIRLPPDVVASLQEAGRMCDLELPATGA